MIKSRQWTIPALLTLAVTCWVFAKAPAQNAETTNQVAQNEEKTVASNTQTQGDVPLLLMPQKEYGIFISGAAYDPQSRLLTASRLVTIDDVFIKGLTIEQIKERLKGPVGSKVKLGVLSSSDSQATLILERFANSEAPASSKPELQKGYNALDTYDAEGLPSEYHKMAESYERVNVEGYASALTNIALQLSTKWPDSKSLTAITSTIKAFIYFDRIGQITKANLLLGQLLQAFSSSSSLPVDSRNLDIFLQLADRLDKTNRIEQSDVVYKKLLSSVNHETPPSRDPTIRVLRAYTKFLARRKRDTDAVKMYDALREALHAAKSKGAEDDMAYFYADHGRAKDAIAIRQENADLAESTLSKDPKRLDQAQVAANALYKLASAQGKDGQEDSAIASLDKAIAIYDSSLEEKRQNDIETWPLFFPTKSDLELKLAELHATKGDLQQAVTLSKRTIARVEQALGENSRYLKGPLSQLAKYEEMLGNKDESIMLSKKADALPGMPEAEAKQPDLIQYDLTVKATNAIGSKDYSAAVDTIEKLINYSKENEQEEGSRSATINGTLALQTLIRELLNHHQFAQANRLYEELLDTYDHSDSSMRLPVLTDRAIFAHEMNLDQKKSWEDLEGAIVFEEKGAVTPISEKLRRWGLAYVYKGDYGRATKLLERALSMAPPQQTATEIPASLPIKNMILADLCFLTIQEKQFDLSNTYLAQALQMSKPISAHIAYKLAHIADAYERLGHPQDAESLLQRAIETPTMPARDQYDPLPLPAFFEWKLAALWNTQQKHAEAEKLANRTRVEYPHPPLRLSILLADVSFDTGNFSEAADGYLNIQKRFVNARIEADSPPDDFLEQLLRKAVIAADKANFPVDKKLAIYKSLAESIRLRKPDEAAHLYEKAMQLFPEGSKEQVQLASTLAGFYGGAAKQEDKMIATQKRAAEMAECSKSASSSSLWKTVAFSEAKAGHCAEALAHIRHALEVMTRHERNDGFMPLVTTRQGAILDLLKQAKCDDKGEDLLKLQVQVVSTIYGVESAEAAQCLAELGKWYSLQHDYQKMESVIQKVLTIYDNQSAAIPQGAPGGNPSVKILLEIALALPDEKQSVEAINILSRVLHIQKKHLHPDADQIADTLSSLGRVYAKVGNYDEAATYFDQSLQILKKYSDASRIPMYYKTVYADVLRKLGRSGEADSLMTETAYREGPGALSVNAETYRKASEQERRGNKEGARLLLQEAYDRARQKAPYSSETLQAINSLCSFYLRENDMPRAEEAYKQQLDLLKVLGDQDYRMPDCLCQLATLCVKQGRPQEAQPYIRKAKLLEASVDYPLVAIEIDAGMTEEAKGDLELIEKELLANRSTSPSSEKFLLESLADLWRKLGQDVRAKHLLEQAANLEPPAEAPPSKPAQIEPARSTPDIQHLYMFDVERRIKRAWHPPTGHERDRVACTFHIDAEGAVSEIVVERSSGVPESDKAAQKAIENAAPFRPLPKGTKEPLTVHMTFDYDLFTGSDRK